MSADGLSEAIAERRAALLARLKAAAAAAGRPPPILVAASKTQPVDALRAAHAAGQRHFGENRVQEAEARWPDLPERAACELRLIGPLQSNKAREALALFDVIETVDRPSLLDALAKERARAADRGQPACGRFLVQVNVGREPQKAGVDPDAAEAFAADAARRLGGLEGLMCIPPAEDDPRPHFEALARLAERLGLPVLSMGMSGDFEAAAACGATHVRIGTALFGPRGPASAAP